MRDLGELAQDFKKAQPETLGEIIRQAEGMVSAQLTIALASDQRALVYSSILGGVIAILVGGASFAVANGLPGLLIIVIPMVFAFMLALCHGVASCRPIDFRTIGNNPRQWIEDIQNQQSLHDSLAETAALYVRAIEENTAALNKNGDLLSAAIRWGIAALALGMVFSLVAISFWPH